MRLVTNVAKALWAYSSGTLVVPGLAYKLFIIRARRDEDVARTMWNRDSDRDRNRERCPRGGGRSGNAHLTQRLAAHLFQSIYQNVNAALNQIH